MDVRAASLRDEVERRRARDDTPTPVAMWGLSQRLRGTWMSGASDTVVAERLRHETLTLDGTVLVETFATPDVSPLNDELVGPIRLRIGFRFVDGDIGARGVHHGTLDWGPDRTVVGVVDGTTNAVAVSPLSTGDTTSGVVLVGRMRATFGHDVVGDCLIEGAYRLEIAELGGDRSDLVGSIEGVVIAADEPERPT